MARKLKVFRTPIGFHDAYVAAPSMKAALEAWGASRNLFAQGAAEEVTDETLTREPLAHPGTVVKVARGSEAQHLAAASAPGNAKKATADGEINARAASKVKRVPRPSRVKADAAERAIETLRGAHDVVRAELRDREQELARERDKLEQAQAAELAELETTRDRALGEYRTKLDTWRSKSGDGS